jgi:CubicO group peptidase (beta-lactamase class C family)
MPANDRLDPPEIARIRRRPAGEHVKTVRFAVVVSGVLFVPFVFAQTAAVAKGSETAQHVQQVEACLQPPVLVKGEGTGCKTLAERMQQLHVPGVSVAVIHNGVIEWARGYGNATEGGASVTPETLFQAGSISKPVAAMGTLSLVQKGKLSLDADINTELKSWKLPPSDAAPAATVTLRELMTHTAGLTVHGFPGYAAAKPVPTLVQVLDGVAPANTAPIRVETPPGTKWNYSGGGYTIMQQMVIDATGEPYPKFLQGTVLGPVGMKHSTYQQPLPTAMVPMAASPYLEDGKAEPGGAHTYPEMAAAGLWTTPSDLCLWLLEMQHSLHGGAGHVLSQATAQEMVTPGKGDWGLGLQIGGSTANKYFAHGGSNVGFESFFVAYEGSGDGAAVMTNGQAGYMLANEVIRSIATVYKWPDFKVTERSQVSVDPAVLAKYPGTYQVAPGFAIKVTLAGDHLMAEGPGQPTFRLYAATPTRFFVTVMNAEIEFVPENSGEVNALVLHQGGRDMRAPKVK